LVRMRRQGTVFVVVSAEQEELWISFNSAAFLRR
jgi:hypothetical protein